MSSSVTSSRKRKRNVSWVDVIVSPHLRELTAVDKDRLVQFLEEEGSPSNFLEHSKNIQAFVCQHVGITGWEDQLIAAIRDVESLPSPINMTWEDAKRILAAEVSRDDNELMKNLPGVEDHMIKELETAFMKADEIFDNRSEMDACVRILQILFAVFGAIPEDKRKKVKMQCQPTVKGHDTFTDYLIVTKENEMPKLLIEAKKARVTTNLRLESEETAQVIREVTVHIIADRDPLPFILTNGKQWSFGLGMKVGNKVSITSTKNVYLEDAGTSSYRILAQLLIKYLS